MTKLIIINAARVTEDIYGTSVVGYKMCFLSLSTAFVRNGFLFDTYLASYTRFTPEVRAEKHVGLHITYPLRLSILIKIRMSSNFAETTEYQTFLGNPLKKSRIIACG
jgi:hypothetical protein